MYKPSAQRELIGWMVRQYRERAGLSIDDAANILGCDRSKLSRIETGMRGFRPAELRILLTEFGIDADTQELLAAISGWREIPGWWQGFLAQLPSAYLDFVIPETFASRSLIYAPLQVPEPLCTQRYAEAMVASALDIREDAEDRIVEAMQQRRRIVLDERRTELAVVIGEAALRQQVGGEAALRQQLIHLAKLTSTDYPQITIRILPFDASSLAAGGTGGFSLLTFDEIPSLHIAHLAGPAGGLTLHDPAITAEYAQAFDTLNAHALDPSRSARKLITMANLKAASRLDSALALEAQRDRAGIPDDHEHRAQVGARSDRRSAQTATNPFAEPMRSPPAKIATKRNRQPHTRARISAQLFAGVAGPTGMAVSLARSVERSRQAWLSYPLPARLLGLAFERRASVPGPRRGVAQKRGASAAVIPGIGRARHGLHPRVTEGDASHGDGDDRGGSA